MLKKFLTVGCLVSTIAGAVGADVRYTLNMTVPGSPSKTHITTWVKAKRQRSETVTDMGAMKMSQVSLTQCDKHQLVQMDPDLKLYTVTAFGDTGKGGAPVGQGQMTMTYSVKDLGKEKISNLDTHHYMLTTHIQGSGCVGNTDTTTKSEIWVTSIQVLECPDAGYSQPNCHVTRVEKGDVKLAHAAYWGMPVKMITYVADKPVAQQDFADYSTDKLSDDLFNVPADFKLVTSAEYQAAQQQKIMKMYQH